VATTKYLHATTYADTRKLDENRREVWEEDDFMQPVVPDGVAVWRLVGSTSVLDRIFWFWEAEVE